MTDPCYSGSWKEVSACELSSQQQRFELNNDACWDLGIELRFKAGPSARGPSEWEITTRGKGRGDGKKQGSIFELRSR